MKETCRPLLATTLVVLVACGNTADDAIAPAAGVNPLDVITRANLTTHLEWLADDARKGRAAGEPAASGSYRLGYIGRT